jgi:cytochrome c553
MASLTKKHLLVGGAVIAAAVVGFFVYLNLAFPTTRCDAAKHLTAPETLGDCYTCHNKVTPVLAQDWKDSKHGALLVKCVVCHGEPDGSGSIPFAVAPGAKEICSRCHEPAMNRMTAKFGELKACVTCHPRHQNPMHRNAFEAVTASDKTEF